MTVQLNIDKLKFGSDIEHYRIKQKLDSLDNVACFIREMLNFLRGVK